ncbi:hypothetical protein C8F01DRAFT_264879 [Mycena amicta]|nr:hypothetical protein C8F01DRAFT_264879 [Mycena amicta]
MNELTSLYRLFLRTCSASVMQQKRSTQTLRKLWRPTFVDAARATTQLQSNSLSAAERNELETWLRDWHLRIDNTLALLYTSSQSRGLAHSLTRNLSEIVYGEQRRINRVRYPKWQPGKDEATAEYTAHHVERLIRRRREEDKPQIDALAWQGLDEVIQMAEGRSGLVLGSAWWLKRTRFR